MASSTSPALKIGRTDSIKMKFYSNSYVKEKQLTELKVAASGETKCEVERRGRGNG